MYKPSPFPSIPSTNAMVYADVMRVLVDREMLYRDVPDLKANPSDAEM
jgi:hypothetical protein